MLRLLGDWSEGNLAPGRFHLLLGLAQRKPPLLAGRNDKEAPCPRWGPGHVSWRTGPALGSSGSQKG